MRIDDKNIDIGLRTPSTVKKITKRNDEEKRGGEGRRERGKRVMTTIETFDFVAKEVTLRCQSRPLPATWLLRFSK